MQRAAPFSHGLVPNCIKHTAVHSLLGGLLGIFVVFGTVKYFLFSISVKFGALATEGKRVPSYLNLCRRETLNQAQVVANDSINASLERKCWLEKTRW